jgi:flavin-binding protein dodecin
MANQNHIQKAMPANETTDKIRVFSNRVGEIRCPDGSVLKYQSAILVSKEIADWLFVSFPKLILKVD